MALGFVTTWSERVALQQAPQLIRYEAVFFVILPALASKAWLHDKPLLSPRSNNFPCSASSSLDLPAGRYIWPLARIWLYTSYHIGYTSYHIALIGMAQLYRK